MKPAVKGGSKYSLWGPQSLHFLGQNRKEEYILEQREQVQILESIVPVDFL
jgi:hypothetical protein